MKEQDIYTEKLNEQQKLAQSKAIRIETLLMKIMNLSVTETPNGLIKARKFDIGADAIISHPYLIIKCVLFYLMAKNSGKEDLVIKYLDDYYQVEDMSMDTILSFVTNELKVGGSYVEIPYNNGVVYIDKMIDDLNEIVSATQK
jgi:hypothetical protein